MTDTASPTPSDLREKIADKLHGPHLSACFAPLQGGGNNGCICQRYVLADKIAPELAALPPPIPGKDWNEGRDAAAKHLNDIADEERTQAELCGYAKSYGAAAVHQDRAFALNIYAKTIRSLSRKGGSRNE